jgi:hypothetical protein
MEATCWHESLLACNQAGWLAGLKLSSLHQPEIALWHNIHHLTTKEDAMTRRKAAESTQDLENLGQPQEPQADHPASGDATSGESSEACKSKWLPRFDSWSDRQAGVFVIEDRENRRMTIKFHDKPSESIREVMKQQYGYQFDREDTVWYKHINPAKGRQARMEADQLAFTVANMIRQEKGLEPKKGFNLGM